MKITLRDGDSNSIRTIASDLLLGVSTQTIRQRLAAQGFSAGQAEHWIDEATALANDLDLDFVKLQ